MDLAEERRVCDPARPLGADSPLARIQRATVDLVAERGYAEVELADVLSRAEVSESVFHSYFAGLQDCCVEIFDCIAERCEAGLYAAYDAPGSWRDRLRLAAYAAARFIQDNPREIRFALIEFGRASELAKARVDWALELYTDLIDAGRQELDDPDSISRSVARSTIGSCFSLLSRQAPGTDPGEATRFVPEMMYLAVRPYLGQKVALEEFAMLAPCEEPGGGS